MNIDVKYGLPIFSADAVGAVGIRIEPGDILNKIRGVGGVEVVYSKHFDFVKAGEVSLSACEVEIGDMNYGMEIDGILGFDFIRSSGLVIDSRELTVLAKE